MTKLPLQNRYKGEDLHVFLVHSNLAVICAMAIIDRKGLRPEDVHFLFYRGYAAPVRYPSSSFPFRSTDGARPYFFGTSFKSVLTARRRLAELDRYIATLSKGRSLHVYFPHAKFDFFRLVVTSPLCRHFSFYEEGSTSITEPTDYSPVKSRTHIRPRDALRSAFARILFGRRVRGLGRYSYYPAGADGYFAFSADAFLHAPSRVHVDVRRGCELCLGVLKPFEADAPPVVLVLDNLNYIPGERPPAYRVEVAKALARLAGDGIRHLHVKNHPGNVGKTGDDLLRFIRENATGLGVSDLPDDICLEMTAWRHPETCFLVRHSSMGIYARELGATVRAF